MDGAEKAIVIIVVAVMTFGALGAYFDSQNKQACFVAAGNNVEAIKECRR